MRLGTVCKSFGLWAAMFLVPASAMASPAAVHRKVRPATERPRAVKQVSTLLRDVRRADYQVRDEAGQLVSFVRNPDLSWETHSDALAQAKSQINKMGRELSRLEKLRAEAAPWQRRAIDQVYPRALALAHNTDAAIWFLRDNENNLIAAPYRRDVTGMYKDASRIHNVIAHAETYAKDRGQERRLARQLGLNS